MQELPVNVAVVAKGAVPSLPSSLCTKLSLTLFERLRRIVYKYIQFCRRISGVGRFALLRRCYRCFYAFCHFNKHNGVFVRDPLQPVAMPDGSVGNELGAVRCSFDDDIVDQSIPWKRLAVGLQIYFREVDTTVKMDIQGQINNIQARLQNAMDEMVDKVRANRTIANETS